MNSQRHTTRTVVIHSQFLPFYHWICCISGAAEIKNFPHMFIQYIVWFVPYLIRPLRYTASTQKMVNYFSSHRLFNIASKYAESKINMWPVEQNLVRTFWRNCDNTPCHRTNFKIIDHPVMYQDTDRNAHGVCKNFFLCV